MASDGACFVFAGKDPAYDVSSQGPAGRTTGTALVLNGNVSLQLNTLIGKVQMGLKLHGNEMNGTINVCGLSVPIVLRRVSS